MNLKKRVERLEQQTKADDWQPKPLSWFYGEREELPPKNRPLTLVDFYRRNDDEEPDSKCKLY